MEKYQTFQLFNNLLKNSSYGKTDENILLSSFLSNGFIIFYVACKYIERQFFKQLESSIHFWYPMYQIFYYQM